MAHGDYEKLTPEAIDELWVVRGRVPPRGVSSLHRVLVSGLVLTMP
jgi:hypothetical protein